MSVSQHLILQSEAQEIITPSITKIMPTDVASLCWSKK